MAKRALASRESGVAATRCNQGNGKVINPAWMRHSKKLLDRLRLVRPVLRLSAGLLDAPLQSFHSAGKPRAVPLRVLKT